jgi:sporulation protein YlmC with PRC-barrel domain
MMNKLLATAAVVAIATSSALAQTQPAPPANSPAVQAPQPAAPAVTKVSSDVLASKLIGQTVYSSDAADAQTIGAISDLIVGTDGKLKSAIVGVGGFLGIGQKNVAIDFSTIKWSIDQNGKQWAVLATTKEQLQAAPAYDTAAVEPKRAAPAATNTTAGTPPAATTTTAANPPPAASTLTAVAPTAVTAKDLDNVVVYSSDNQNVGEISDVVVDISGKVDAVIVDVGGFLGIGEKPVAIGFNGLDIRKDKDNKVFAYSKLSKAQLDAATKYDKSAYEAQRDKMRVVPQT